MDNAHHLVQECCTKIAAKVNLPYSVVRHRCTVRLSGILQKGNAQLMHKRIDAINCSRLRSPDAEAQRHQLDCEGVKN
jgi:hypothetical protein